MVRSFSVGSGFLRSLPSLSSSPPVCVDTKVVFFTMLYLDSDYGKSYDDTYTLPTTDVTVLFGGFDVVGVRALIKAMMYTLL
jgi:hypothetical protein